MEKDVKEKLDKLRKKIKVADRFRLVFLFAALMMVLFIFYGNKFAMETTWYESSRVTIYNILFYAVFFMLVSSLSKIVLVTKYNRILKKQ